MTMMARVVLPCPDGRVVHTSPLGIWFVDLRACEGCGDARRVRVDRTPRETPDGYSEHYPLYCGACRLDIQADEFERRAVKLRARADGIRAKRRRPKAARAGKGRAK